MRQVRLTLPLTLLMLALTLTPTAVGAQGGPDEAAVSNVVRQLFDAYARADLEGFMAVWSRNSPDYAARKEAMAQIFAGTRDIQLKSLAVENIVVEGARARALVRAELTGVDVSTGEQSSWLGKLRRAVQLVREDGGWRIWRYIPVEQQLADLLSAAGTKEERQQLLRKEAESVTPVLVQLLLTAGDAQASGGDLAGGLKVVDIAFEVADVLGAPTPRGWCFWFRGGIYENRGRREEALKDYEQAVALFRQAGDATMTANLLNRAAAVRHQLGRGPEALGAAEEALKLAREAGHKALEMEVLNTLGLLHDSASAYGASLAAYEAALKLARELGRKTEASAVLNNMGVVYRKSGRYDDALRAYGQSLELERELKNEVGAAQLQLNVASVHQSLGRYDEALAQYLRALEFFRARGLKDEESKTLNNIGSIRLNTGAYEAAQQAFEASLKLKREAGDRAGESVALNNLANFFLVTARYGRAEELYRESLKLKHELGDKAGVAAVLNNLGTIHKSTGNYTEALDAHRESLRISREIANPEGAASALNNIGLVQTSAGELADALLTFEESLKLARQIGDRANEARVLQNIGTTYDTLGRYDDALIYLERSRALESELGNRAGVAAALHNRANVYQNLGRYEPARAAYEESLRIAREIGDRLLEAQTLHDVATTSVEAGRHEEARAPLAAALKIVRDSGDRDTEAVMLNTLAELDAAAGRPEEALRALEASLKITETSGDADTAIHSHHQFGDIYRGRGDWSRAAAAYQRAVGLIETMRTRARDHTLRISLFGQYVASYYGLARSLLETGDADGALAITERAKARSLVDLMQGGGDRLAKTVTDAERAEERRLADEAAALTLQLDAVRAQPKADESEVGRVAERLAAARAAYDEMRRKIFLSHPELQVQLAEFKPADLVQLNQALFDEQPNLALLSYFTGNDETLLFVVTRGRTRSSPASLKTYRLPVKRQALVGLLRRFREKLGAGAAGGPSRARLASRAALQNYSGEARALYDVLLAPAKRELAGKSHLVIAPDPALSALPFQALLDERKQHLVARHSLSYAPSLTALLKMSERAERLRVGETTILAVGRPRYRSGLADLPASEEEVKAIAGLFGSRPLLGAEASEARVKSAAARARYLHFATHGLLNETAPMYSAVALTDGDGEDGALHARELMEMNLGAEMAVLSACETALGQVASGEGVMGLAWALFVAGVPSSVVSQWAVADESTSKLMVEFYRQLKVEAPSGSRPSKAEALRRAQLKLMGDGRHAHPYYWAPFVLIGEWRN